MEGLAVRAGCSGPNLSPAGSDSGTRLCGRRISCRLSTGAAYGGVVGFEIVSVVICVAQSFPAGAAFVQREARLGADKGGGAVDAILAALSLLRPVSNNADCGFEVQYSPLPRLRSAERH